MKTRTRARRTRRDERGDAIVVFCVGLVLLILPLGGISVDLWHAVSQERALQSAADAAAADGAGGIDTTAYRQGTLILDPVQATNLAMARLQAETGLPAMTSPPEIDVSPTQIVVILHAAVPVTLLKLAGGTSIDMTATASSAPRASGP
jgi:Flp pilus assembly protein TadG